MFHEAFSALAILLTLVAFAPYIRSIRANATRPHVFSWVIWGITTAVITGAQFTDHGGVGAWPTGLSALITLYVAWLAWQHRGDTQITRSDWVFFMLALAAIPLWIATQDPLHAVILLTTIDLLGFAPTFRKAYHAPYQEHAGFYALMLLRNLVSIVALENLTLTTVLFPAAVGAGCAALLPVLWWRRDMLKKKDGAIERT